MCRPAVVLDSGVADAGRGSWFGLLTSKDVNARMDGKHVVVVKGMGFRRTAVRVFDSEGEAETFRVKVAEHQPGLNTFTGELFDDNDSCIRWALGGVR